MKLEMQFTSDKAKDAYGSMLYGSDHAAGMDLRAMIDEPICLAPGDVEMIPSGIKMNLGALARTMFLPPCYKMAGFVLPRSGRGTKEGLCLANTIGLIDSDFFGEVMIPVYARPQPGVPLIIIRPGERIAQLVIHWVLRPEFDIVKEFSSSSARGENGFGSSGVA